MAKETVIEYIRITCKYCDVSNDYAWSEIELSTHSDECELCGSHGKSEVMIWCKGCQKYSDIEVSSW